MGARTPANHQQPSTSPGGQYVLTLPIKKNTNGDTVWQVTISDPDGEQLYQDEDSTFVGNLNVYWVWDDAERVWLYVSDTGKVYFWEAVEGTWTKVKWGYGKVREIERDLTPPDELYPSYVQ